MARVYAPAICGCHVWFYSGPGTVHPDVSKGCDGHIRALNEAEMAVFLVGGVAALKSLIAQVPEAS